MNVNKNHASGKGTSLSSLTFDIEGGPLRLHDLENKNQINTRKCQKHFGGKSRHEVKSEGVLMTAFITAGTKTHNFEF